MAKIIIIEDELSIRNVLKNILSGEDKNYKIDEAENGEIGINLLFSKKYDLVLCDIKMPKMDGLDVLKKSKELDYDVPFIMISGHGDLDTAVECIKNGAYDYISKPPDLNRLLTAVRNGLNISNLENTNKILKSKIKTFSHKMIGESQSISDVKEIINKIAPTNSRVLITGENGTGKELVARSIHENSNRKKIPMIEVNCAAIPNELIESELFGHEKGSFTSAHKQKKGKFEIADEGTIFLDEIGDMSLSAQSKVLRALQENKITRVGGEKSINVDVRVIATNKDLIKEIQEGRFREDLYHRLSVIKIKVPPLRERKIDIPLLTKYFIETICKEQGINTKIIDEDAIIFLQEKDWTGNIRELRNVIERLIILSSEKITKKDVELYY